MLLKLFLAMVLTLALPFLAFYSLHDVILPSFGVSDESMVLSAIGALVVLKICTLSYVYSALREDAQEKQANKGKEGETHESKKEHNE